MNISKSVFALIAISISLIVIPQCHGILPDNLTVPIIDVNNDGQADELVLVKRSLRRPGCKVLLWYTDGTYQDVSAPQVRTYRGYVKSDPDIQVNAVIEPGNIMHVNFTDGRHHTLRLSNIAVDVSGPEGIIDPGSGNIAVPFTIDRISPTPNGYIVPKYNMRKIHVGVDIANDFYLAMGSDIEKAVARVEQRVNDSDHFYARDMGIAWEIQEIVIRIDGEPDNWKSWWTGSQSAYVNTKMKFKAPGGGGSSGRLFDPLTIDHQHTCTLGSTSPYSRSLGHEVAHGFGAGHYSSWEDTMSGSRSALGTGTVQRMIGHAHEALEAAAPKIIYGAPIHPHAMEDCANTDINQSVDINVLENDFDGNGQTITLEYVDSDTEKGATIQHLGNGIVRYMPATDFVGIDRFEYHVSDSSGLTNRNGKVKVYVRSPGLASHLVLDATDGNTLWDLGPYQAHGQMENGLTISTASVAGVLGNAIENTTNATTSRASFDTGDPLDGSMTVSLWVKYAEVPATTGVIACKGAAVISGRMDNPRGGWAIENVDSSGFRFIGNMQRNSIDDTEYFDRTSNTSIQAGKWYHLAMVLDRDSQQIRAWVDGQEIANTTFGSHIADGMIENYYPLRLFNCSNDDASRPCIIDDVRIYNIALPAAAITAYDVAKDEIPAGAPQPANLTNDIIGGESIETSWRPGKPDGYVFDVYFGTDKQAVIDADVDSVLYKGRQSQLSYLAATDANLNYYWRIDSVKDGDIVTRGPVWRFGTFGKLKVEPILYNPGFENPALEPGDSTGGALDWFDASSYLNTSCAGGAFPATTEGDNWLELGNDKWAYQNICLYAKDTEYKVKMLLGQKTGSSFLGVKVSLWAGGNISLAADGVDLASVGAVRIADSGLVKPDLGSDAIEEIEVILTTGSTLNNGLPLWLEVRQGGGNGRTLVDNVRIVRIDNQAPNSDPMGWEIEPHAINSDSISMKAVLAIDDVDVQYYFTCLNDLAHSSGWQVSQTYTDTGLVENVQYSYTVKARDKSVSLNETQVSVIKTVKSLLHK
ncbi:MAG: cadherin-like domain-containing protein [Phycisphaerae bacterium]|nr:cadherin-like domain-containing protein [Phycisphaerae bacterium]